MVFPKYLRLLGIQLVLSTLLGWSGAVLASSALDDTFSTLQAHRGEFLFNNHCARCHTLGQVGDMAFDRWQGRPLGELYDRVHQTMPPEGLKPEAQDYLDILAASFIHHTISPGTTQAVVGDDSWRGLLIEPADVGQADAAAPVEWPAYRGNVMAQAYSPLDQINRDNASQLKIAWRWAARNQGPTPEVRNIATPLMVDGVLYITAGITRNVVAVDAETGETLWMWRPQEDEARFTDAPRKGSGRGVAYWRGDSGGGRILTVTPGFRLVALDAETGLPVPGFGQGGSIDLKENLRVAPDTKIQIASTSPPLVVGDVVIVGPAGATSTLTKSSVKGDVQAFDVRTGERRWVFKTIPEPEDASPEAWANGSAAYTGNAGVWAPMSADLELGLVYLPVESPTNDFYGGNRPGSNLYANSLVCLDAQTGEVRWHFQITHHDIWDWDLPAAPILIDIPRQGKPPVKAVAQITKQAFLYVFDRQSGEPLWPIEERAVPQSTVPGEQTWPTQPVPSRPAAFDRQTISKKDLIDFTPEVRQRALAVVESFQFGDMYAPPTLADPEGKFLGIIKYPLASGGGNWFSGAADPDTGVVYVSSMTPTPMVVTLSPTGNGEYQAYNKPVVVDGLPLVKPPWGRITAIDLKSGEHLWMRANGGAPRIVKEHPLLKGVELGDTGKPNMAGLLVTKTLLFAGEGWSLWGLAGSEGGWEGDPLLRVHDKATGEALAEIPLPASQVGLPMTYLWKGKQYIVMIVGNGRDPAEVVALTLP